MRPDLELIQLGPADEERYMGSNVSTRYPEGMLLSYLELLHRP